MPTDIPLPDPPIPAEAITLMVEHAAYSTAQHVIAACEPCREDFQNTYDVLDFQLDEELSVQTLTETLQLMKLLELTGPEGSLIIQTNLLAIRMGKAVKDQAVTEEQAHDVGMAVWVGLNKLSSKVKP